MKHSSDFLSDSYILDSRGKTLRDVLDHEFDLMEDDCLFDDDLELLQYDKRKYKK